MKKILFLSLFFIALTANAFAYDGELSSASGMPGDEITITLQFSDNDLDVIGIDTKLSWDKDVLEFVSVENGSTFPDFASNSHSPEEGEVIVTQFSFSAVSDVSGEALVFTFKIKNTAPTGTTPINLLQFDLSDQSATASVENIVNGSVTVAGGGGGNASPILDSIGNKEIDEESELAFTVSANDPNNDPLTFSAEFLPIGAVFDANSRMFSWTPTDNQSGIYQVLFKVSDGRGGTDSETITITVNDKPNNPPQMDAIGNKNVEAESNLSFTVTATDPDSDPLSFSSPSLPIGASFNTTTNTFFWTPLASQVGTHQVTFNVSDGGGGTDSETITITVTAKANTQPVLNSIGDKTVEEEGLLRFTVSGSDADSDPLSFSATNLPVGAIFDTATRIFTWTPTTTQSGAYDVTFTVDDGRDGTDSETITITVTDKFSNTPPVLGAIGNRSVNESEVLNFTVNATDLDGDDVIIEASGLVSWMSFDGSSFSATPGFNDAGSYNVTFTADDGNGGTDAETIVITVNNTNRAPVLDTIGNKSVEEGGNLSFNVTTSDPDGDGVSISTNALEDWMSFDGTSFAANPDVGDEGNYSVTFTASDGSLTDSETITISVGNVNRAPMLDSIGDKNVNEGASLNFTLSGSDPDGDTLIFSAQGLESWMSFVDNTFIANAPELDEDSTYQITFTVSDGELEDFETITLTVKNIVVNAPPVIDGPGDQTIKVGQTLSFTISVFDEDGDSVALALNNLPGDASFDGTTGLFEWTPKEEDIGKYELTITADDGNGGTDTQSFFIEVESEDFVLNADKFPYVRSLDNGTDPVEKFSGPAVAKMLIQYMWWNRFDHPDGPPELFDEQLSNQELLFQFGEPFNYGVNDDLNALDMRGLWKVIQNLDPDFVPYHYNFGMKSLATQEEALNEIAKWVSYPAGGGSDNPFGSGVDGHPVYIPAAVPFGGDYNNWVVVKGVRATDDPFTAEDYGIHGFWINDPAPSGIGENTFVTAEQFVQNYYLPLTKIDPTEQNFNKFVAVVEPPKTENKARVVKAKPRFKKRIENFLQLKTIELENGSEKNVYVRDHIDEDAFVIIQAAVDGIEEQLVPYDEDFAQIFKNTIARKPLYVSSEKGDYYLVAFDKPLDEDKLKERMTRTVTEFKDDDSDSVKLRSGEERKEKKQIFKKLRKTLKKRTVVIAIVDADSGAFREVTWVREPIKYLPVNKRKALRLLSKLLQKDLTRKERREFIRTMMQGAELELVYIEGSFFYPAWKIYYYGQIYLVDQEGHITHPNP